MSSGGYSIAPGPNYAAYANPNFGQQLGQIIANYPNDYFQGTQQRRQLELQKPIIDPATGEPSTDPHLVATELMKRGGAEYSKDLIPFLQKQPIFDKILRENNEGGYDAAAEPASAPPSRSNVEQAPLAPPQPRLSSAGTDNKGTETINSLASSVFGERDVTELLPRYAAAVGNRLGEDLTPEQAQAAQKMMLRTKASMGAAPPESRANQTPGLTDGDTEGSASTASMNGIAAAPFMGGGASGSPAPVGRGGGEAPQRPLVGPGNASVAQMVPGGGGQAPDQHPLKGLVPDAYLDRPEMYIAGQRKRAEAIRRQGDLRGVVGIPSKAKEDQAAAIDKNMNDLESLIGKSNEPTEAEKVYRAGRNRGESLVDFQARQAGAKKASEDEASEVGKTMEKMATEGLDAIGHKAMLDTVQKLGEKVPYGVIPKIQSELGKFGIETKGLSDIQAYERAIDYMAPQLRPIGSGRLMQQELTAFKSSLGGLMTTPDGRRVSVENLKLLSDYKEAVGRIASDSNIPIRSRMERIYQLPPPHLKTLDDVGGTSSAQGRSATPPSGTPHGARQAQDGNWYVPDPGRPGKYLMVQH
jgi:hypothetical protein